MKKKEIINRNLGKLSLAPKTKINFLIFRATLNTIKYSVFFLLPFLFTACSSMFGEPLSIAYIFFLWIGVILGYVLSCLIWAGDNPGHKYTPWWEVFLWFFFTLVGAAISYIKYFFLFSGLIISIFVPVIAMSIVTLIVRIIRKKILGKHLVT